MAKIVIDPLTRIEGHLRIEAQIDGGKVTDAWSSATMFRGLEAILKGRDPREAWMYAQRICGVCTTVHSIASVRAVENALGITIPDNARILRNLMEGVQFVQDHIMHFYHLHAFDWVDVTSAIKADAGAASALQKSISSWTNNSTAYFQGVKDRLTKFVNSGQLGIFANGYWGHPAYKLPAEANLVLAAHYLEALNFQRDFIKIHAMFGGKNPHPQTYAVGGMAIPLARTTTLDTINPAVIGTMKALAAQALDFVKRVYIPDVLLAAKHYKEWANYGSTGGKYLSYGDFPATANNPASYFLPGGVVVNNNIGAAPLGIMQRYIGEYVSHSWFKYSGGDGVALHPNLGETTINFTGPNPPFDYLNTDGKYSWLKSPRYNAQPMEVGPLSRMLVAYAAGHVRVKALIGSVLTTLNVPATALFSTLGRIAARAVETQVIAEQLGPWLDQLLANINRGDLTVANTAKWDPSTWPAAANGWGTTEAPRGALGHWVYIKNGVIDKYQMIVATAWNASPRDANNVRGPFEQSLVNTPIADPNRPLEILRTIHSFDPCMACAVHVLDAKRNPLVKVANTLQRA